MAIYPQMFQETLRQNIQSLANYLAEQKKSQNAFALANIRHPSVQARRNMFGLTSPATSPVSASPNIGKMLQEYKNTVLGLTSGFLSPEQVLPAETIAKIAPLSLGGGALTPPGATFQAGEIFSPAGERIGEYTPGFEPKRFTAGLPETFGRQFGITKEQAQREVLGLPEPKKPEKTTLAQRTNKANVLRLLEIGGPADSPYTSREDAEYDIMRFDTNVTDPDIQQALAQYKPAKKSRSRAKYKAGDTVVISGVRYKRNKKGEWLPVK